MCFHLMKAVELVAAVEQGGGPIDERNKAFGRPCGFGSTDCAFFLNVFRNLIVLGF